MRGAIGVGAAAARDDLGDGTEEAAAAWMVLLGGIDQYGFTFFTDRHRLNGKSLDAEKQAALLFF